MDDILNDGLRRLRRLTLVLRRFLRRGFDATLRRLRRVVVFFRFLRRRGFTINISLMLFILYSCISEFILTPDNMK